MKKIILILFLSALASGAFAQSKSVIKCSIWQPESFCNIPDSLITLPRIIKIDSASVRYVDCKEIDKMAAKTGVWLTLSNKGGSKLRFESNYKNISIVKQDSTVIHPDAILWKYVGGFERKEILRYMTSELKTNKYESNFSFQKKIDLIMIFSSAEKGDKLIIDNFVEAVIQ